MSSRLEPSSVRRIRVALGEISGALRYEPIPEDAGVGEERGLEVVISDPDGGSRLDMADAPPQPDGAGGAADEPRIGFEIPPRMTDADVRNLLGENRMSELRRLHEIRGVDALGWYLSFHQLTHQYGIYIQYIQLEAVVWLALEFFSHVTAPLERKVELAFHAVLRHELFHFEVDCMIANWELATGVEVYWSSRGYRNAAGYIELEEGLANAYMLRGFRYRSRPLGDTLAYTRLSNDSANGSPPVTTMERRISRADPGASICASAASSRIITTRLPRFSSKFPMNSTRSDCIPMSRR